MIDVKHPLHAKSPRLERLTMLYSLCPDETTRAVLLTTATQFVGVGADGLFRVSQESFAGARVRLHVSSTSCSLHALSPSLPQVEVNGITETHTLLRDGDVLTMNGEHAHTVRTVHASAAVGLIASASTKDRARPPRPPNNHERPILQTGHDPRVVTNLARLYGQQVDLESCRGRQQLALDRILVLAEQASANTRVIDLAAFRASKAFSSLALPDWVALDRDHIDFALAAASRSWCEIDLDPTERTHLGFDFDEETIEDVMSASLAFGPRFGGDDRSAELEIQWAVQIELSSDQYLLSIECFGERGGDVVSAMYPLDASCPNLDPDSFDPDEPHRGGLFLDDSALGFSPTRVIGVRILCRLVKP